jgi:D-serine deaminase-like pyridoxal phosphate-dependent protein
MGPHNVLIDERVNGPNKVRFGIRRFKSATIAEAEMLADAGAPHILLAYPLVGPNIERYLSLITLRPGSHFYAVGEAFETLKQLSDAAAAKGMRVDTLLDVNLGMNRTGIPTDEALAVYAQCAALSGIRLCGLHCYDGHHNDKDKAVRCERVEAALAKVDELVKGIEAHGLACPIKIMAGTPSFPCHVSHRDEFLSPGTCFLMDYGYMTNVPDLPFVPAAALLTRVVSRPAPGMFTLDLGYKGIAADPAGVRGVIVNLEMAEPVLHSEEHWVWKMASGFEQRTPAVGSVLYVIPTHICPCSALYPSALVAEGNRIVDEWPITARNRKLTI